MYEGLIHAHSGLRYIVLLFLLISIIKAFKGWKQELAFTKSDNRWAFWTVMAVHIQFILGLILYFWGPWDDLWPHMKEVMQNSVQRFWVIEHLFGMLVAVILVTVGRARSKRQIVPAKKHRSIAIYFLISLIIILISIPWPFRESLGRGWF